MRTSKRDSILRTAIKFIGENDLNSLSFESLAEATGVSKSGIIYHFSSRHGLLLAMHEMLAQDWADQLRAIAGASDDPREKLRAVVTTLAETVSRAELLLLIDAKSNPDFLAPWKKVEEEWMIDALDIENDDYKRQLYLIQSAADGLFVHEYIFGPPLTESQRQRMLQTLLDLIPAENWFPG